MTFLTVILTFLLVPNAAIRSRTWAIAFFLVMEERPSFSSCLELVTRYITCKLPKEKAKEDMSCVRT